MKFKLAYYEDGNLIIEVNKDALSFTCKSGRFEVEHVKDSIAIFKYVSRCVSEINDEINQPERLSEENPKG